MPHTNAGAGFGREMTAVPGTRARPEGNLQLPTTFQEQRATSPAFPGKWGKPVRANWCHHLLRWLTVIYGLTEFLHSSPSDRHLGARYLLRFFGAANEVRSQFSPRSNHRPNWLKPLTVRHFHKR